MSRKANRTIHIQVELHEALEGCNNASEVANEILCNNIDKIGMHTIEDRDLLMRTVFRDKLKKGLKGLVRRCMEETVEEFLHE